MYDISANPSCNVCHGTGKEIIDEEEFPCSQCIAEAVNWGEVPADTEEAIEVHPFLDFSGKEYYHITINHWPSDWPKPPNWKGVQSD